MDDSRFDDLTRALAAPRRAALRLGAGGALGLLLGWRAVEEAAAHNALAKCKKIRDKKKRKTCLRKARAHNNGHVENAQPQCTTPDECPSPSPDQLCARAVCDGEGKCGIGPKTAGTVCRPVAGTCDLPEVCDGASLDCPPDQFRPASVVCRPPAGPCDVAEQCTGSSAQCPPDVFRSSGFQCGFATGPCDRAALCTGTSANCPPNPFRSSSEVCRPKVDACDRAEFCTGNSAICPPDQNEPNGATCETDRVCCFGACCDPGWECGGAGCCKTSGTCTAQCCYGCEPLDPENPQGARVCVSGP